MYTAPLRSRVAGAKWREYDDKVRKSASLGSGWLGGKETRHGTLRADGDVLL